MSSAEGDPIAVVGLACRAPGASTPAELWQLLSEGRHAVGPFDAQRAALLGVDPKVEEGFRFGGTISNVTRFDNKFFGISNREARAMDPQQRHLLEVSWETVTDAGVLHASLRNERVGVFVGLHASDYSERLSQSDQPESVIELTGSARNAAAARIAYQYGLRGPAVVVDTDRSSSLVAVHLAVESIDANQCSMALAGGSNLVLSPRITRAFGRSGMLAADGQCKFGDASADGFVRSDGIGMVLLMPLTEALKRGLRPYAVIRRSALVSDGGRSGDLMTPSIESQAELLRACYRPGDLERVVYVEAHGTGTPTGDFVETAALAQVLCGSARDSQPLLVGSLKTNIGHAESAAGVLGLIKVCLSLDQRAIPPSCHFKTPNPKIDFRRLRIPTQLVTLSDRKVVDCLFGVSSFGLTGTYAHVALSGVERPGHEGSVNELPRRLPTVFALSAGSDQALRATALSFAERLGKQAAVASPRQSEIDAMASDLLFRRTHLGTRVAVVASNLDEAHAALDAFAHSADHPALVATDGPLNRPKVAFVFPGQGSQWLGMGRKLYETYGCFRDVIDSADAIVASLGGWSLKAELFADQASSRIAQLDVVQPLLVAVDIGIAAVWRELGLTPNFVIGTSMGEAAAAHVAGVLSLEDTFKVICRRTKLMKRLSGQGAMAVVELSAKDAEREIADLNDRLSIAVSNSPSSTVIAGDPAAIQEVLRRLEQRNVFCKPVKVDVASHSPQMDPLRDELLAALHDLRPSRAVTPLYSTVELGWQEGEAMNAAYWVRNLRLPVLLADAVGQVLREGPVIFVECSPHPILVGPIGDTIAAAGTDGAVIGSVRRESDEVFELARASGALWSLGMPSPLERATPRLRYFRDAALPAAEWGGELHWAVGSAVTAAVPAAVATLPGAVDEGVGKHKSLVEQLREMPPQRQLQHIASYLQKVVVTALRLPADEAVDPRRSFREYGLTSLMAVEISNALGRALGAKFPATLLFSYPSVDALAQYLVKAEPPPRQSPGLLGDVLVDCGIITKQQLDLALAEHRRNNASERLGSILLRLGMVTAAQLHQALLAQNAEPIAIIGMACRFPGANSVDEFWSLLHDGKDAITEVPRDRWDPERYYSPDKAQPGKMVTKWGGFVSDIAGFDAPFFGLSPREAEDMDPQQRMLLEVAWEAAEDAFIAPEKLAGVKGGVFIGIMNFNDYVSRKHLANDPSLIRAHHGSGTATSIAAGRLAYYFGLNGPTLSVDTACSSSLVAVHLACQSLRAGESKMAIAGGVNAILSPEMSISFSKAGMMSPDGRCHTFDAAANGYVRSEGCGLVVLKRLSDAISSGDRVHAVIYGSAVNQDGRSSGLTAPNPKAQVALLREAVANAGIERAEIHYVEAHGTGTPLGDPIEVQSLGEAFGSAREQQAPLWVGSVKSNIGHLESAAGIAGLLKVVLSMKHGVIPRNLHFNTLNPNIDAVKANVRVPRQNEPWPDGNRRAGVSSFGFSGTNAHVVLGSVATPARSQEQLLNRPVHVLPLSAKSDAALKELARRYLALLGSEELCSVANIAYSAATGRAHFQSRVAIVAETVAELKGGLEAFLSGHHSPAVAVGSRKTATLPTVAFLFSGQGLQYAGMGRFLYETLPLFRSSFDKCARVLEAMLGVSPTTILYSHDIDPGLVNETMYTQPLLVAFEYALATVWASWGITPSFMLGHSVGELAAAMFGGAIELEAGLVKVAERAKLVQGLPRDGKMVAVFATMEDVAPLLSQLEVEVSVAAINGPRSIVLSGKTATVDRVVRLLTSQGVEAKELPVSHAFHSPCLDPILAPYERTMSTLSYSQPRIPIVSNLTGEFFDSATTMSARYWRDHMRAPVQFSRGVQTLVEQGCRIFVEIGPTPGLVSMARAGAALPDALWLPSLRKGKSDWRQMLETLGALYAAGLNPNWVDFLSGTEHKLADLPKYPFQHVQYWFGGQTTQRTEAAPSAAPSPKHPLLGVAVTPDHQNQRKHPLLGQPVSARPEEPVPPKHPLLGKVVS